MKISRLTRFRLVVLTTCLLFWIGDSLCAGWTSRETNFARHFFSPAHGEFESRFITVFLLIGLGFYSERFIARHAPHVFAKKTSEAGNGLFKVIADVASDSIFCKDQKRRYTFANPAMEKLLGCSASEITGKTPVEIFGEREAAVIKEVDDQVYSGQIADEVRALSIGEKVYHFHTVQVPLRDLRGNVSGMCGIVRDITARRHAEEERLKEQKLESIGIFAGGIAHSFNNLLTAILGNISLAELDLERDCEMSVLLTEAKDSCRKAAELTKQLLTFAKGGEPITKSVSPAEFIKNSAIAALQGPDTRYRYFFDEDLWPIEADEGQLKQVVQNLIANAEQAMPQGGEIEVRAHNVEVKAETDPKIRHLSAGKYVKITFEDQGLGIAEKFLPKIFDPYFSTKQKCGLGLATCYSIVKKHRGYIGVKSVLGSGTVFEVYLPASCPCKKDPGPAVMMRGQGKVLVMDDEKQIKNVAGKMLEHLGYDAEFADDGARALDMYRNAMNAGKPYAVVLLDLIIPEKMGGEECLAHLRQIDPAVKAIVTSGYSDNPVMANFRSYHFRGSLAKPFQIEELGEILHRVICE